MNLQNPIPLLILSLILSILSLSEGVPKLSHEFQYQQISLPPEAAATGDDDDGKIEEDGSKSWVLNMLPKLKGGARPPASAPSKQTNGVITVH
ncbi:hypothetical protein LINPERPRIM_LOCUS43199 [Linum perenne]